MQAEKRRIMEPKLNKILKSIYNVDPFKRVSQDQIDAMIPRLLEGYLSFYTNGGGFKSVRDTDAFDLEKEAE